MLLHWCYHHRLGQQNLLTTYTMEKSMDGGNTWMTVLSNRIVPPANIGARSIEDGTVGLGAASYAAVMTAAIGAWITYHSWDRLQLGAD